MNFKEKLIKFANWAAIFFGFKLNDWEVGLINSLDNHIDDWVIVTIPFEKNLHNPKTKTWIHTCLLDYCARIPGNQYSFSWKASRHISRAIKRVEKRNKENKRKEDLKKSEDYICDVITNFH